MKEKIKRCSQPVGKIHSCREKGKQFELRNPAQKTIKFVDVDGCLFRNEQKKCDFMYEIYHNATHLERVFFVELKGIHFNDGVEQLEETIQRLTDYSEYQSVSDKRAYLVGRAIPSLNTGVQKVKSLFLKKYRVKFTARTNKMSVSV